MAVLYGTMQNGQLVPVEADAQGRLVAELAGGGSASSGFKNVLINGAVTINQRNVDYASAAVGDYWADRWKKTAGGMTQVVEAGSFRPSTEYTLSGVGVTTQQITSPANSDWTIPDIPATATYIQLEEGSVATPFEYRPVATELALCMRYFQTFDGSPMFYPAVMTSTGSGIIGLARYYSAPRPVVMRINPVETATTDIGTPNSNSNSRVIYISVIDVPRESDSVRLTSLSSDAEF